MSNPEATKVWRAEISKPDFELTIALD